MKQIFCVFWCMAALLTLDRVLRPSSSEQSPRPTEFGTDTLPVIQALQTRCELPAGTTVFVVREQAR